jgi:hypothetical protein
VVWLDGGISGIVNIGNSGNVDFTSGEQTVTVHPHQFSTAPSGGAPGLPQVLAGNAPLGILAAVAGTEFTEQPQTETPEQAIQVLGSSVPSSLTHGERGRGKENAPGQTGKTPAELLGTAPGKTPGGTPSQGSEPPGLAGTTPGQTVGGTPGYGRGLGNGPNTSPPGPPIVISAGGQPIPGLAGSGRGRGGGPPTGVGVCGAPPCGKAK